MNLTQEALKSLLIYNDDTGNFVWLPSAKYRRKDNKPAGTIKNNEYVQIMIGYKRYYAHRLAWLYVYGYMPLDCIDHIDGNKSNNAISNLREATQNQNKQNLTLGSARTKTGLLGVTKNGNRFVAKICVNGKQRYLGAFDSKEEAHFAYIKSKRELHEFCTI